MDFWRRLVVLAAVADKTPLLDEARPKFQASFTCWEDMLAAGDLELVKLLLGRSYSISGRVVDGDKLGKKIGFPTANIQLKHNRPPLSGIFAVEVEVEVEVEGQGNGKCASVDSPTLNTLQGVASLGVRPTVHEHGKPVLEVYLFDFDQEIYGRHLRVHFLHKLRNEEKYPDLETLTKQIGQDVDNAKSYFSSLSLPQPLTVKKGIFRRSR